MVLTICYTSFKFRKPNFNCTLHFSLRVENIPYGLFVILDNVQKEEVVAVRVGETESGCVAKWQEIATDQCKMTSRDKFTTLYLEQLIRCNEVHAKLRFDVQLLVRRSVNKELHYLYNKSNNLILGNSY